MGISIDVTANAKGFVTAAGEAAASLTDITDQLKFIAANADLGDEQLQKMFTDAISKSEAAASAQQNYYRQATAGEREVINAVQQQSRSVQELQQQYERLATTPAVFDETLVRTGQTAEESGQKIEESSRLGEGAMMNLGYSAMSASSLFTGGLSGMAEQAGTFAAFMGPTFAGVEGAVGAIAWPLTIAGVALAAIGGLMQSDTQDAQQLTQAVSDYVSAALGSSQGSDALDQGLRKWAKSAQDFGGMSLSDLKANLKDTSIEFGDVAGAIATQSLPKMEQQKKAVDDLAKAIDDGFVPSSKVTSQGLRNVSDALGKNIEQQKLYKETLRDVAAQQGLTVDQYLKQQNAADAAAKAQQAWSKTVQSGFQSAAESSSDWAQSSTVDLDTMTKNLSEYNAMVLRLPQDIQTALSNGLSQAGLTFIESLPNGEQILDKLGMDPGSASNQAFIAQANQAGQSMGQKFNDGVNAAGNPNPKTVPIYADDSSYQAVLQRIKNSRPVMYVDVRANAQSGLRWFN